MQDIDRYLSFQFGRFGALESVCEYWLLTAWLTHTVVFQVSFL